MRYTVTITRSAEKALAKLERPIAEEIKTAINLLANDPRPHGAKKLVSADEWRIRVRDYRIIYLIEDKQLIVEVVKLGHRRDIYR